jgi:mannose-1-phosphate guanylyltransferase/mannose-6-phosphate isomerase
VLLPASAQRNIRFREREFDPIHSLPMTKTDIIPVILSGGAGTRLWPVSRAAQPKQLMALAGELTMLQQTADRLLGLEGLGRPIVVCSAAHRHLVSVQLEARGHDPRLIIEPVGRNTAPAAAAAALDASATGRDPLLLVLPADHVITDGTAFKATISAAVPYAEEGQLVTFGIVPDSPETGYGYIEMGDAIDPGVHIIERFVEKPDAVTAEAYLAGGKHLWNSGMFLFRASAYLTELETNEPDIAGAVRAAVTAGAEDGALVLDTDAFGACPSDSIDFAVMEHTTSGVVLPLDAGWSDVGSWDALWGVLDKDDAGNAKTGDALVLESADSYVHATSRLVAAYGIDDLVVVETPDAVLVVPRDRAQGVRTIVDELRDRDRPEASAASVEHRPWGSFEVLTGGDRYRVKRLVVQPGASLSLQAHRHRAEEWIVANGTAEVMRDDDLLLVGEGETVSVAIGQRHRLANPGQIPLVVIEVQLGSYLGEDDIEGFEDDSGGS